MRFIPFLWHSFLPSLPLSVPVSWLVSSSTRVRPLRSSSTILVLRDSRVAASPRPSSHVVAIEAVSPIVHVRLSSLSSSSRSDVHQASVSLSRFLPPLGPFLSFRPRSSVVGRSAAPTRSPMILPLPGGKAVLGGLAAVVHGKGEGCEIGDHVTDVTGTAGNAEQRPPIVILCRCRR